MCWSKSSSVVSSSVPREGESGRIDEGIHAAEVRDRLGHAVERGIGLRHIGFDEVGSRKFCLESLSDVRASAGESHLSALTDCGANDAAADALRAATDQYDGVG